MPGQAQGIVMCFLEPIISELLALFVFQKLIQKLKSEVLIMADAGKGIIIKFEFRSEQTVADITKMVGLVKAKHLFPVIDGLDLEANPRSSKTGSVTAAIHDSIEQDTNLLPFKTKGILLACSNYEIFERGRVKVWPENREIEGILDGGHNTLAIGIYILERALELQKKSLPRGKKTWGEFKADWERYHDAVSSYLEYLRETGRDDLDFYIPVELLVPKDPNDIGCIDSFRSNLSEICAARNNNVQLQESAKVHQLGFFVDLEKCFERYQPELVSNIQWKPNDGGRIRVEDIIALAWIPLSLTGPFNDDRGKPVNPISPVDIYNHKAACLKQFEKMMYCPDVTIESGSDYKRELRNTEVSSAFRIAVDLPELYDYIFDNFPTLYNKADGNYGNIKSVKGVNEKRKKLTPFFEREIETMSPEGYIVPLVYGLQALMEKKKVGEYSKIVWKCDPHNFLKENLFKIVKSYKGLFSICDYDPQKIGKSAQSYEQALNGYKMALAGIL